MSHLPIKGFTPCWKRSVLSLFVLAFLLISDFGVSNRLWAQSMGVRPSFREGFLRVEWDPAPSGASAWRIRVIAFTDELTNGNLLVCGPGTAGFGSCPSEIGTTFVEIDLTQPLLAGGLRGSLLIFVSVEALAGGPISSGTFVGRVPTPRFCWSKVPETARAA